MEKSKHVADQATVISVEQWHERATLCELLVRSLKCPDPVLAQAVASGTWAQAAGELADSLSLSLPPNWDAELSGYAHNLDSDSLFHLLRIEYTRLYAQAPRSAVIPYEGSWHAAKKGERPLLFVNAEALAVGEACRFLGLERGGDANDSLDSVVIELEVLWCIALMAAGILACPKDVVAKEAWESFFEQHVTSWMDGFAEDTLSETDEPFYKATAYMLQAFVKSMG